MQKLGPLQTNVFEKKAEEEGPEMLWEQEGHPAQEKRRWKVILRALSGRERVGIEELVEKFLLKKNARELYQERGGAPKTFF